MSTGTGQSYTARSFTFTADSALTTLTFRDVSPTTTDVDSCLDFVRIRPTVAAVASAPSTPSTQVALANALPVPAPVGLPASLQFVPRPDRIVVTEGRATDRLSSGAVTLLENDGVGAHRVVSAAVLVPPRQGELLLNSDGSFTYTHNGGRDAEDQFTYTLTDGVTHSEPASSWSGSFGSIP